MEKEVETDLQPGPEEPLSDYEIDAELYLEGIPDLGAVVLFIHPDSAICLGVCPERLPPSLARSAEQRANEERERAAQDALLRTQARDYYNVTVKRRKQVFLALLALDFLYWISILVAQMIFKVRGEDVGDADIGAPGGHGSDGDSPHNSPFSPWIQTIHIRVELVVFSLIIDFIGCVAAMQPRTSILTLFLVLIMLGTAVISLQGITLFLLWRLTLITFGFWFRTAVHIYTLMDLAASGGAQSSEGIYINVANLLDIMRGFFGILFGISSTVSNSTAGSAGSAGTAAAGTAAAPPANNATNIPHGTVVAGATGASASVASARAGQQGGSAVAGARAALNAARGPHVPFSLGPAFAALQARQGVPAPSVPAAVALQSAPNGGITATGLQQQPQTVATMSAAAVASGSTGSGTVTTTGAVPDIEMGQLGHRSGDNARRVLPLSGGAANQFGMSSYPSTSAGQGGGTNSAPASPALVHMRQPHQAQGAHAPSTHPAPSAPHLPALSSTNPQQPSSMQSRAQHPAPMRSSAPLLPPQQAYSLQMNSGLSGPTWAQPAAASRPQQLPPLLPATFNPLWQPAGTSAGGTSAVLPMHVLPGSSNAIAPPRYSHPGHSSGGFVVTPPKQGPQTTATPLTSATQVHPPFRSNSTGLTPSQGLPRVGSQGSGVGRVAGSNNSGRLPGIAEAGQQGPVGASGTLAGLQQQVQPGSMQPVGSNHSGFTGVRSQQHSAGAQAAAAATNTLLFQAAMLAALKDMRRVHAEQKGRKAARAAAAPGDAVAGAVTTTSAAGGVSAAEAQTGRAGTSSAVGAHPNQPGALPGLTCDDGTLPVRTAQQAARPGSDSAGNDHASCAGASGDQAARPVVGDQPALAGSQKQVAWRTGQIEDSNLPASHNQSGTGITERSGSLTEVSAASAVTPAAAEGLQEATALADLLLQELNSKQ